MVNQQFDTNEIEKSVTCLDAICKLKQRLSIQPSSLNSASHAKIAQSIMDKFRKESRVIVREYEQITTNPEKIQEEQEQRENAEQRKERRRRLSLQDADTKYSRRSGIMSASFLEEGLAGSGQYESTDIGAIKRGGKGAGRGAGRGHEMDDFIEEDEDEDDGWEDSRRASLSKKRGGDKGKRAEKDEEEEDEDEDEYEEEEEEDNDDGDDEDKDEEDGDGEEAEVKKRPVSIAATPVVRAEKRPVVPDTAHESVRDGDVDPGDNDDTPQQRKRVRRAVVESDDDE